MTLEDIISIVCEELGLTQTQIMSQSRIQKYVEARFILFDVLTWQGYPQKAITEYLGKDRSTVTYGINRLADWIQYDKKLNTKYQLIRARIDGKG